MIVLHILIKSFLGFYKRKLSVFVIIFLWPCLVVRKNQDFIIRKSGKQTKKKPTKQSRKPNQNLFQCFWNHFSLAMFSSQKESRYENQENRPKKTQQNNQENQTKICFSVFFLLFFFFFYFLNPFITSFSFFPASVVNKSTCKFI